jgi:hypothetical protein
MDSVKYELADAMWNATHRHGHVGFELEFRVGHALQGGHFSPNVGRQNFQKLRQKMDASSKFSRVVDIETIERIAGIKHVTTLSFADSAQGQCPLPPSYCMTKTKVFQKDLPTETPYTLRCGMAMEKTVPLAQVASKLTRHKKRRRYVWKCWAFDLTEVSSNGDLDSEETFEVEIELLDPEMLFQCTMDSLADWGLVLCREMIGMLQT